jgi:hypothetical protein
MLKEVEGRSIEELAAMASLNENTIKVRLFRVRQKLLKVAQQFRHIQRALSETHFSSERKLTEFRAYRVDSARNRSSRPRTFHESLVAYRKVSVSAG